MVNRPKRLGTEFETDVVRYLREHGAPLAERRALAGSADRGDVAGTEYVWECKNTASIDLAGGITEMLQETQNAGVDYGFLVVKRRRKSTADAYAVMPLSQLCQLLYGNTDRSPMGRIEAHECPDPQSLYPLGPMRGH